MVDKIYKIGSIGCGSVQMSHMRSHSMLMMLGDRLVGFYDIDPKKAEMAKRIYTKILQDFIDGKLRSPVRIWGYEPSEEEIVEKCKENLAELKVYNNVESLFENVDIVDVTTPHRYHVDYAVMALERNVHVMTEKPMGRTWWESRRIKEAAEKSKAKYQLSDNNAYIPRFQMLKKAIDAGYIGEINCFEFYHGSGWPGHDDSSPFFWDPIEAGGGAMMDYASHAVTLSMFLTSFEAKVLSVKSMGIRRVFKNRPLRGLMQEIHVDDDVHIKILFEDPKSKNWITARFQAGWIPSIIGKGESEENSYVRVIGGEGEITGDHTTKDEEGYFWEVKKFGHGNKKLYFPGPWRQEYGINRPQMNAIMSFLRALNDGKEPLTNVDVGLTNMAIMGAAYLSELMGRTPVTIEEFRKFCEDIASGYAEEEKIPVAIIKELLKPYQ